ncbi:ATP-dependent nuclease [Methanolapillus ohkumae]|uniref:AAA family ATPase n=1 Tax=Methanolapillus ohkumae TaxID=3028298 RepID=A0AA96V6F1_9EURY|nr:hypothetical protein MsAm2_07660 [Methanosarcinaceae archaeon Am2]
MIHKLVLKNFKKIKEETFEFDQFDIIVGANNSGKSTALQALAIWQYCVDLFRIEDKSGDTRSIQLILPNFTALPLPEFNLLWTDRLVKTTTKNTPVYIEINVFWRNGTGAEKNLNILLNYVSPQSVYAKPEIGWSKFKKLDQENELPRIVYVPPFSGLETNEKWLDDGNIRQNVGKAQPGSVLRNLLYRVVDQEIPVVENKEWNEINSQIKKWFDVELLPPEYKKGISTEITVEYKIKSKIKRVFDIISGGSGFHQILTILAFFHGYKGVTTILFDEPDAHLHVNLQRQVVNYFKQKSAETNIQFLIASHSEEFIKGVDTNSIISIMSGRPKRIENNEEIIQALSDIDNIDIIRTQDSPYILYVEGEDDERILSSWADVLNKSDCYVKFYPYILGGTTKKEMNEKSKKHYTALKQINTDLKRILLLDNDLNPMNMPQGQIVCNEWKRKNIDSYFFVPDAWKRVIQEDAALYTQECEVIIDSFFVSQNLILPPNSTWENVKARLFETLDGKKMLFEDSDSLFHQIRNVCGISVTKVRLASKMKVDEIHEDVKQFFNNMEMILK